MKRWLLPRFFPLKLSFFFVLVNCTRGAIPDKETGMDGCGNHGQFCLPQKENIKRKEEEKKDAVYNDVSSQKSNTLPSDFSSGPASDSEKLNRPEQKLREEGAEGQAAEKKMDVANMAISKPKNFGEFDLERDVQEKSKPPSKPFESRLGAITFQTRVYEKPDISSFRVGEIRAGALVDSDPKRIAGNGCPEGFRAIKPFGYVCMSDASIDLRHPVVRAVPRGPDEAQKLPYMYGIVKRGGPIYARLPTEEDLKTFEPHLEQHLERWKKDKESGAPYGVELWYKWKNEAPVDALVALREKKTDPSIPWFLENGGRVPNVYSSSGSRQSSSVKVGELSVHNGVAALDSFLWQGRRYNLTTDLKLVPADRFRPIKGSDFHGVTLGDDIQLPIAFIRKKNAKKYMEKGGLAVATDSLDFRSIFALTGKTKKWKGKFFFETKEGFYLHEDDCSRTDTAKKMPGWALAGEKWIDVSIAKQLIVAYEGTKPVYTTLVSTGEDGLAVVEEGKVTKRGIFRIHTKYISSTMDSKVVGEEFELRDVPYVQYFQDGYAFHAAYWHDVFGQPKSHGCINLAPEDARRLFHWTGPEVPLGWHGVAKANVGTVVFIHR